MARLFRIGGYFVVFLAVCGFVSWKLIGVWDQKLHGAEYRKRLAITAANVFVATNLDNPDDTLRIYAVNVVHTIPPFRKWFIGYGIYLGNGTVITAAHVIGHWPSITDPRVFIAGQDLPAKVIREGSPDRTDLALLSVNQDRLPISLRLRRNSLCKGPIQVGSKVVVDYPERTVKSRTISPLLIAPPDRLRFNTLINEAEGSGSGVFDAEKKCLLGIISKETPKFAFRDEHGRIVIDTTGGYAGYFVPVSKIADFIPPEFRF